MSLQGLQNYTQPLNLKCATTINGDLNAKNVYINGLITGAGVSTNILGSDNVWTGTNDLYGATTYTGVEDLTPNSLMTNGDVDAEIASFNPLTRANVWKIAPTFSNANPPIVPEIAGTSIDLLALYSQKSMENYINTNSTNVTLNNTNTFTGTNSFTGSFTGVSNFLQTSLTNQAIVKFYADTTIEAGGKTLTSVITTSGNYYFSGTNRANVAKIDYLLFGGSCGGASGSVVTGTIGNGLGNSGIIQVSIGTIADPAIEYKEYTQTAVSSNTYVAINNKILSTAGGACNLNGTIIVGSPILPNAFGGQNGSSCNGQLAQNNEMAYSNVLGTTTSAGGCILIIQSL